MKEIKIYLDLNKTEEVTEEIEFDIVSAGETTTRQIYVENIIQYPISIQFDVVGKDIEIIETMESLEPNQLRPVVFKLTPSATVMQPVKADLKIKLEYVVR